MIVLFRPVMSQRKFFTYPPLFIFVFFILFRDVALQDWLLV